MINLYYAFLVIAPFFAGYAFSKIKDAGRSLHECQTQLKRQAQQRSEERQFIAFIHGDQRFILNYPSGDVVGAESALRAWLADSELEFTQEDFEAMMKHVRDVELPQ